MIMQLTVFLENSEGRLADLCRTLANAGVNMSALTIAETSDYGIVRIICDNVFHAVDVLDEAGGWKLERNKVTGHARILDPQKVRRAWGSPTKMKEAFRKVKRAVDGPRQRTTRVPSAVRDGRRQQSEE